MATAADHRYKATESKYKGGAEEMYITYDLWQEIRGEGKTLYPKVKRVYIAGKVKAWQVGTFEKRTGKEVHGVKIDYEQSRAGYRREGYMARRGNARYRVPPTQVKASQAHFSKIVEVPDAAQNVQFHMEELPQQYRPTLQEVR